MLKLIMKRLIAASLFLVAGVSAFAQSWNLTSDYLPNTNPNGAWQYGQINSNVFSSLAWTGDAYGTPGQTAFVYQNTSAVEAYGIGAGQVSIESDWGNAAVQWTAPSTGLYDISVSMGGTTANDGPGYGNNFAKYAGLSINGTSQVSQSFVNNIMTWNFTNVSLASGSTVDAFVLNPGYANGGNTETHFSVQSVPEPVSIVTLAFGAVSFFRNRKKN